MNNFYVLLLTVRNIMATSNIPQEPLSAIINSNTHVDFFDHYSQTIKDAVDKDSKFKIHPISINGTNSSQPNPRRFTVPEIMTQEPVAPTPVSSILGELQEEVEVRL